MNYSKKIFCSLSMVASLMLSGAIYADNCYDPYNNTYFACNVDEENYAYPVSGEVVYGGVAVDDVDTYHDNNYNGNNGYDHNNYQNNYNHGNNNYQGNNYHGGGRR